jgi:hypothetical protein
MSDTMTPTPEQVNKLAAELVPYLKTAIAAAPTAAQDEHVATAMKMWLDGSFRIAKLADDKRFRDHIFEICA